MTIEKFFSELDKTPIMREDLLVKIGKRYSWEDKMSYSNEVLYYDGDHDTWCWLNDWHEGEPHIEIYGARPISMIPIASFREVGIE